MLGCSSGGGPSAAASLASNASFRTWSASISTFSSGSANPAFDRLDDLLNVALDPFELALGSAQAGSLLHPETVHLLRKLAAELLESR